MLRNPLKISSCILCFFLFYGMQNGYAQPGIWTWIHGSSSLGNPGVFGTQGVSSPANMPPGMYETTQWTDLNGNFWIYGGNPPGLVFVADLWKYNPVINEWTWMKGPGTGWYAGNYGIKGLSAPANNPPSRGYGAATWTDLQGNLWFFGGLDQTNCNSDLWKYNIATNEWTWMKGPNVNAQPGIYGIQGIPDIANNPAARYECSSTWTDNAGDLWLFGGYKSGKQNFNDLWRYKIATNTWTWMKGSSTTNQKGIYGTKGVENPANTPGARHAYTHWSDSVGNFYLFGGLSAIDSILFNDMWRYNVTTGNWTWMNGDSVTSVGISGSYCVTNPAHNPSGRLESRAVATYKNNFWLFGGFQDYKAQTELNNLWMYCVASNRWIWQSGDSIVNPVGNWGAIGVPSPTNKPDGRGGAVGWSDGKGNLYMYGGWNYNGDLWRYTIDTLCGTCPQGAPPDAQFISSDTLFCDESGKCIDFTDQSTGNPVSWKWHFQGAIPDTSSLQNPVNICYYTPGTYTVKLIVTNALGSDSMNVTPLIVFGAGAAKPILTLSSDTIFSSHASAYQWYFNGSPISGATDSFYVATLDGDYNVFITDDIGCSRLGDGLIFTSANEINGSTAISIYPNPANNELFIRCHGILVGQSIEIYNILGEQVFYDLLNSSQKIIDTKLFHAGIYFIKINTGEKQVIQKLIIQHN